ncbi:MAG: AI-2E family transporter YdiK [Candidatus Eisenbacteria bacterium]
MSTSGLTVSTPAARDLARSTLAVLFILGLTLASFWILRPFLPAVLWATTIVIATWPIMTALQRRMGGKRGLATATMITGLALAVIVPILFGVGAVINGSTALRSWAQDLPNRTFPALPAWVAGLPLVGARAQEGWTRLTAAGSEGIRTQLSGYADEIARWLLGRIGNLVGMLVQLLVTLLIATALYAGGERVAAGLLRFSRRLGGASGEEATRLAALAVRGVALGVVVTALIQTVLAGVGMAIARAPRPGLFTAAVFVTCLAQLGPTPVMLIAVLWLYAKAHTLAATLLLVWMLLVGTIDNVLRPVLIKRSVDLPFALIFSGVIGGLLAFGVVGLFIGPVVLAVGRSLVERWMAGDAGGETRSVADTART